MRWCVFFIDSLIVSMSSGRIDLRFTISTEMPSFASSSAAWTQKWTPMEWATKVISLPIRCILAWWIRILLNYKYITFYKKPIICLNISIVHLLNTFPIGATCSLLITSSPTSKLVPYKSSFSRNMTGSGSRMAA